MSHYIEAIGWLEPSTVIRRFLDAPRTPNLAAFLEVLHTKVGVSLGCQMVVIIHSMLSQAALLQHAQFQGLVHQIGSSAAHQVKPPSQSIIGDSPIHFVFWHGSLPENTSAL